MQKLANQKEMGNYLKSEILKKYKSVRNFSKEYLKTKHEEIDDESVNRMSNRLSQILNGKPGKTIQTYDLPIFSELLELSYEQILSAGKDHFPTFNHLTNYSVALSNNPEKWDRYIHNKNKIILNADEYGKTIIDYALEFKNYKLLKYLMDKNYIWFVEKNTTGNYWDSFGAGTSIEKESFLFKNYEVLDVRLKSQYELRIQMITLAVENHDLDMLNKLRAREIPALYNACKFVYYVYTEREELRKKYDLELVEILSEADEEILSYFAEEFKIDSDKKENFFMYPYISNLIELLIKKEKRSVVALLENSIKHNKKVYAEMLKIYKSQKEYYEDKLSYGCVSENKENSQVDYMATLQLYYIKEAETVCYYKNDGGKSVISNLVKIDMASNDEEINQLIKELKRSYNQIFVKFLLKKV